MPSKLEIAMARNYVKRLAPNQRMEALADFLDGFETPDLDAVVSIIAGIKANRAPVRNVGAGAYQHLDLK